MSDRARIAPEADGFVQGIESDARPGTFLTVTEDPERRAAITALREEGPLEAHELVDRVLARTREVPVGSVSDEERRRMSTALHHRHLPRLADAGFVELERADGSVRVRQDAGFGADALETIERIADHDCGETMLAVLANSDRGRVAAALERSTEPLSVSTLAESLAAAETDHSETPAGTSVDSARVSLHHVHLPKLDDAGLVEYDPSSGRVESIDFPKPLSDFLGD